MPATAATLVRRQKRMRIWLQARQHILTLRSNLRFPQTIPIEVDACRKLAVPKLQVAGSSLIEEGGGLRGRKRCFEGGPAEMVAELGLELEAEVRGIHFRWQRAQVLLDYSSEKLFKDYNEL